MSTLESAVTQAVPPPPRPVGRGLEVRRFFTEPGRHPFDLVSWECRTVSIKTVGGESVFEQEGVEVPTSWSANACAIVAQKYFHGSLGDEGRESSVKDLISRVAGTLGKWGRDGGYFSDEGAALAFEHEICHLLVHQMASFNSPVWFNLGVDPWPQCSACFINAVTDSMEAILSLATTEGMLFKHGSGAGCNLSPIRSSREALTGGGTASGPVSFMRGLNSFAGVIKSGGKTRRAAKMVILDVDHPDIEEFIRCKVEEELKARALIAAGYDPSFDTPGGAYDSVQHQNANHSVRVSDEFMQAVAEDREWPTIARTSGEVVERFSARALLSGMAEAAWQCGDPGIQYDTAINRWHTCKGSGRIDASNPCSEFMFIDDSACNLASLNLLAFMDPEKGFRVEAFRQAVDLLVLAQEIIVGFSRYPNQKITSNSQDFRPLGLGYSNLGAMLMAEGFPYDSVEGRSLAAAVTALMTGEAYLQSARIAASLGAFAAFEDNREPMLEVLERHREEAARIDAEGNNSRLTGTAVEAWDRALELAAQSGLRNAQVTVLAPTGTISLMMDCTTTGIEPEIALVKTRQLIDGGNLRLVNQTVPRALKRLGYAPEASNRIVEHVESCGTVEGSPDLAAEHLAVFDCALRPADGTRSISPKGHLHMMAAVQPLLSGAISKTVNVPEETSAKAIEELFITGWGLGLKSVAVYRDNCKGSQPVALSGTSSTATAATHPQPARRHLPDERQAITHKFCVEGQKGYVTVGLFEDGSPGELFITIAKEGSTLSGVMDAFATAISMTLQYGVPLESLVRKFSHLRFEPAGWTNNPELPRAQSLIDYIFRWMELRFLAPDGLQAAGIGNAALTDKVPDFGQADAPTCRSCGSIMQRTGSCHTCPTCGASGGCGG